MLNNNYVPVDDIEEFHRKISCNIKRIRIEKEMSQLEVALSLGFASVTFYTNAENNKRGKHFNLEHLYKLSKIFEVEVADLLA